MIINTHGNGNGLNDLYLAFEPNESEKIAAVKCYLKEQGRTFSYFVGDAEFKGKICIEVPFSEDLIDAIRGLK